MELINKESISMIIQHTINDLILKNGTKNFNKFDKYSKGIVDGMNIIWNELELGDNNAR